MDGFFCWARVISQLHGVENDVAIIANENGAFVVSVMTQDGSAVEQIDAMKSLGLNLYENILN